MSEWEDAPRLRGALDALTHRAALESEEAAWDALLVHVEREEAGDVRGAIVLSESSEADVARMELRRTRTEPRASRLWSAVAAAACVLLAIVAAVLLPSRAEELDTADSLGDACEALPAEPTLVTTDTGISVQVSSTARLARGEAFRTHDPTVIDTAGLRDNPLGFSTLVSAPGLQPERLSQLVDELTAARCSLLAGTPMYLIANGEAVRAGAGCALSASGGFWGVVVVDVAAPPSDCAPTRTVLIGGDEPQLSRWQVHHGCVDPDRETDPCGDGLLTLIPTEGDASASVASVLEQLWEDG